MQVHSLFTTTWKASGPNTTVNVGKLRFQLDAQPCTTPKQYTRVINVCEWEIYMEIAGKHAIQDTHPITIQYPIQYTSGIGNSCQTLPRHIQLLVGNIPEMDMPDKCDEETPRDIIVATYGSVVFRFSISHLGCSNQERTHASVWRWSRRW
jgi:hypothetical protein